jgi:hypothetical protein
VNKARDDLGPLVNKAREDIAPYVSKAKEELNKFGEQAKNSAAAGQAVATGAAPPPSDNLVPGGGSTASSSSSISSSASAETLGPTSTVTDQPKEATMGDISFYGEVMTSPNSGTAPPLPDEAPAQVNALLHKMQALQTQIQANPSIAQLSRTLPNLSQIQGNIATLQSRLPGQLSGAEAYLGRATKEFSDLLKDAVRVVPPTADAAAGSSTATTSRGAMTRKEGLLHRLRSDPQVMLVDPAQPPAELPADAAATTETAESVAAKVDDFKSRTDAREDFAKFLQAIEDEGGLEGEGWRAKVEGELALGDGEGSALAGTLAALGAHVSESLCRRAEKDARLVPAKMPAEAFWTRYFFRVHQIDEDDARRRQVLEGVSPRALRTRRQPPERLCRRCVAERGRLQLGCGGGRRLVAEDGHRAGRGQGQGARDRRRRRLARHFALARQRPHDLGRAQHDAGLGSQLERGGDGDEHVFVRRGEPEGVGGREAEQGRGRGQRLGMKAECILYF